MLSQTNINKINDQIRAELRTVDRYLVSEEDKDTAIKRIAQLKELLDESPSRKGILRELAIALIEAREETRDRNTPADVWEALFGIR